MSPKVKEAATAAAAPTNGTADTATVSAFKAARRVSTPIVAIETPDPASTINSLRKAMPEKTPVLAWDIAKGLRGVNDAGRIAFNALEIDPNMTVNPVEMLLACEKLPDLSVVFLHNAHRQLHEVAVVQALWNLRDLFKVNKRMVVLLGPAFTLPAELSGDVIVLDEPLPTREELGVILDQQHKNAELALPDDETRASALDAIVGLPSFTAEQVSAMALEKKGISIPKCWDRKIKSVQNTPGLSVYRPIPGETTLDELKGIDNVVTFMKKLVTADAFNVIVFLDEMDKAFAGGMSDHTGDSGVAKDQVGQVLTYINDTKSLGVMLAGVAGSGKTQLAKAVSMSSGKPLIIFDLGGMKGGIVGESERMIRAALKVVTATAEGRVLFIGTANRTTIFTPEMNRRFPDQFFFDTLSDDGRAAVWPVYVKKNGLTASQAEIPDGFDTGWTGAEIQRACERAALFGESVVDAAKFIIPQAVSARTTIAQMRRESADRFLSASYEGLYQMPDASAISAPAVTRQIEVG